MNRNCICTERIACAAVAAPALGAKIVLIRGATV
jgi:hypothetical protein